MSKNKNSLGETKITSRGFEYISFTDRSGVKCGIQQSSLAEYCQPGTSAIWIGCDEANPKIMAVNAGKFGIKTDQTTGWIDYPVPEDVLMNTRAHLDRKQVKALIKHLQKWVKEGTFEL